MICINSKVQTGYLDHWHTILNKADIIYVSRPKKEPSLSLQRLLSPPTSTILPHKMAFVAHYSRAEPSSPASPKFPSIKLPIQNSHTLHFPLPTPLDSKFTHSSCFPLFTNCRCSTTTATTTRHYRIEEKGDVGKSDGTVPSSLMTPSPCRCCESISHNIFNLLYVN